MTLPVEMKLLRENDPHLIIIDKNDSEHFENVTGQYIMPFAVAGYGKNYLELDSKWFSKAKHYGRSCVKFNPTTNELIFQGLNKDLVMESKTVKKLPDLDNWFKRQRVLRRKSAKLQ